ncbi:MAG: mannose-1-phosphate guanylyltransferase [Planctomycetales bacterium]
MLHAVIMAGGSGTRFWPQSRRLRPKQLLSVSSERTLLQETYDRCADQIPSRNWWVVTNRTLVGETQEQLPEVPAGQILQEPCGRNTAPCIGLAALQIVKHDPEGIMLVMPADHVIRPVEAYRNAVQRAVSHVAAHPSTLVLFGVPPTYPATGFGYIEREEPLGAPELKTFKVATFHEKPPLETAENFLDAGGYYWNCGIFVWRADRILEALRDYQPLIADQLDKLAPHVGTANWDNALAEIFPAMTSISIDHAVLEKATQVVVLEAPFEWDDVGSWLAMARLLGADDEGNTVVGDYVGLDSRNCIIRTTPEHLIATVGMENCLIIHTPDATLVARRDDENAIRQLVALLEQRGYGRFL